MIKISYFVVVVAALVFDQSVNALQCFQGQRLSINGNSISDITNNNECLDPSHICNRLDVTGTSNDQSSKGC